MSGVFPLKFSDENAEKNLLLNQKSGDVTETTGGCLHLTFTLQKSVISMAIGNKVNKRLFVR